MNIEIILEPLKEEHRPACFARGGALMYFSVRGRAAEQGIIFRIPTPRQGIIFVKIGSTTGSIWGPYGHF